MRHAVDVDGNDHEITVEDGRDVGLREPVAELVAPAAPWGSKRHEDALVFRLARDRPSLSTTCASWGVTVQRVRKSLTLPGS